MDSLVSPMKQNEAFFTFCATDPKCVTGLELTLVSDGIRIHVTFM